MSTVAKGPDRLYVSVPALVTMYGADLVDAINHRIPEPWRVLTDLPVPPMLAYRRRCAAASRRNYPTWRSGCSHCGMRWDEGNRSGRSVRYATDEYGRGHGLFVVCRWCWPNSTPAQRFVYAYLTVFSWWPRTGVAVDRCVGDWPAIAAAYGGVPDATAPFGFRPPEVTA